MKTWIIIVCTVIIIVAVIFMFLSGADVMNQQIESSDFIHHSGDIYISPEINIWFKSSGYINWASGHNDTSFYLVPASDISQVNSTNLPTISLQPIKYAGGPDTYVYLGLSGSYFVVALSHSNPSGISSYGFSHPPYPVDPLVGGPRNYAQAQEAFLLSISSIIIALGVIISMRSREKILEMHRKGNTIKKTIPGYLKRNSLKFLKTLNRRKSIAIAMAFLLFFAVFTVTQYESKPPVITVLPLKDVYSTNVSSNYSDNISFSLLSPFVTGKYYAAMTGPTPQEGGLNSTQIFSWAFSLQVTKTYQRSSIFFMSQTALVKNLTLKIGSYVLPFKINSYDVNLAQLNGGVCSNPSGTFSTGTEFALYISLTNEISCKIPDGNYTMSINLTLQPQSVMGPYHVPGNSKIIGLTFPVYINNSNTLTNTG